jgi:hypothetical protein
MCRRQSWHASKYWHCQAPVLETLQNLSACTQWALHSMSSDMFLCTNARQAWRFLGGMELIGESRSFCVHLPLQRCKAGGAAMHVVTLTLFLVRRSCAQVKSELADFGGPGSASECGLLCRQAATHSKWARLGGSCGHCAWNAPFTAPMLHTGVRRACRSWEILRYWRGRTTLWAATTPSGQDWWSGSAMDSTRRTAAALWMRLLIMLICSLSSTVSFIARYAL